MRIIMMAAIAAGAMLLAAPAVTFAKDDKVKVEEVKPGKEVTPEHHKELVDKVIMVPENIKKDAKDKDDEWIKLCKETKDPDICK